MGSCFRRLRDCAEAPEEPRVYAIGIRRGCWFHHKYLGMSNNSGRTRLRKRYTGRGNENVADHVMKLHFDKMLEAEGAAAGTVLRRDNLWMRWSRAIDSVRTEAQFWRHYHYPWNDALPPRHRTASPGVLDVMPGAVAAEPRSALATQPRRARSPRDRED